MAACVNLETDLSVLFKIYKQHIEIYSKNKSIKTAPLSGQIMFKARVYDWIQSLKCYLKACVERQFCQTRMQKQALHSLYLVKCMILTKNTMGNILKTLMFHKNMLCNF